MEKKTKKQKKNKTKQDEDEKEKERRRKKPVGGASRRLREISAQNSAVVEIVNTF